jgi:hypothetical protein
LEENAAVSQRSPQAGSLDSKVGGKESTNGLRFHFKKEGSVYDITAKILLEVIRSTI